MKSTGRVEAFTAVCALLLGGLFTPLAAAERPNIIFILADDQGWGDVGYNGHPYARTPHIDRLAAEGTVVSQFYVNSPVCSPSRAAFMTGRYPAREGFHTITSAVDENRRRHIPDWLNPDVSTIADAFKAAGYVTAHFGKWHLGRFNGAPEPAEYGFEVAAVVTGAGRMLEDYHKGDAAALARAPKDSQGRLTQFTFDAGIDFVRAHRDRPFYLNVWAPLPHTPLRFSGDQLEVFANLPPDPGHRAFGPWMGKYLGSALQPRVQMQTYLAALACLDENIGRLLAVLKELGLEENTIVVFSSDNGPEDQVWFNAGNAGMGSPGPFRGRKRSLYEGGVRVPFVARWPGHIPAGHVDRTSIMSGVDLLPTLASLAGVRPAGTDIDGENLSSVLLGRPAPRQRPLFWEWLFDVAGDDKYLPPPLAVRDGPWKLYVDYAGATVELYDVTRDPSELVNLAGRHPDVAGRLTAEVKGWAKSLPPEEFREAIAGGAGRIKTIGPGGKGP